MTRRAEELESGMEFESRGAYRKFYEASSERYGAVTRKDAARIAETTAHLPAHFGSVLDVGCADGRLLGSIPASGLRVGVDLSLENLRRFTEQSLARLQADIGQMPFPSRSFDLVICTEVLEHLPDEIFTQALRELDRLARRYIFISVPNQEDLRENAVYCTRCAQWFHSWGHLRSFRPKALPSIFPSALLIGQWAVGPPESRYARTLLWIRSKLRVGSGTPGVSCPQCAALPEEPAGRWRVILARACELVHWNLTGRFFKRPYWLCALYEKSQ